MNQTVHISVDAAELIDSLQWEVPRKGIGRLGVRGAIGHDGGLILRMNGTAIATLFVHEDERGRVVVDAIKGIDGGALARFYPEDEGHVPERTKKPRVS